MAHVDEIVLSRWFIIRTLTGITLLLLIASVVGQLLKYLFGYDVAFGLIRLFYVDEEANIPTFFSSSLLLLASLLLKLISALKKKSHDGRWFQWTILSFALLFMAIDEAAGIHELLHGPAEWVLHQRATGIFYFAWVIFGFAFVLIFAASYLKFFFSLHRQTQVQFFAAAATFLSGALGIEVAGGYYAGLYGEHNLQYALIATLEEAFEMAGVIILINALLAYVQTCQTEIRLRFAESGGNEVARTQKHVV